MVNELGAFPEVCKKEFAGDGGGYARCNPQ
jgi:hypothetical protein